MNQDFFQYLEKLELLAFFSGYPLWYAIVKAFSGQRSTETKDRRISGKILPYTYALTATLYAGFCADKLYPDWSFTSWKLLFSHTWLVPWAFTALVFWIPAAGKRTYLSLLHSIPFFFILLSDILHYHFNSPGSGRPTNEMNMYGISVLIQAVVYCSIYLVHRLASVASKI